MYQGLKTVKGKSKMLPLYQDKKEHEKKTLKTGLFFSFIDSFHEYDFFYFLDHIPS